MAGKLLSLLPPLLLAAVGLAGLLLLCVPTQDVREPPALKVHAPIAALVWEAAGWGLGGRGQGRQGRGAVGESRSAPSERLGLPRQRGTNPRCTSSRVLGSALDFY